MKALGLIVKLDGEFKSTIKYGSLELAVSEVAIDMNQHGNREQCGVVAHCRDYKWIEEGDTVWFHHSITTGHRNRLSVKDRNNRKDETSNHYKIDGEKGWYLVPYADGGNHGYNILAYAVKKKNGEIYSLGDFVFGVPSEDDMDEATENIVLTRKRREKGFPLEAKIKYVTKEFNDIGIKVGDVVGLTSDSDYQMEIEGETVWRFRLRDIAYIRRGTKEEPVFEPFVDWVMVEHEEPKETTQSGLFIPQTARKMTTLARVLGIGRKDSPNVVGKECIVCRPKNSYLLHDRKYLTREENVVPHSLIPR